MQIVEVLGRGYENKKTTQEIMHLTGITTKRRLVAVIAAERRKHVICSCTNNGGGYYLPASRKDIENNLRSLEGRGRAVLMACKAARKELRECDGQQILIECDRQQETGVH